MDTQTSTATQQPASLSDVLLAYFQDVEAGRKPDREELLARHPHLADDLAALFDAQERLYTLLGPMCLTLPARPEASAVPPDSFGDYQIEGELGKGAMGVVYKARQVQLDRVVALKMIRSAGLADAEERARFKAEARAVARLQHPNIVQVFEVGEHEGMPFLALEFVPGGNLADQTRGVPWEARRVAALVEKLARAVCHAHEKGIVHRDLKPGNVLLTATGEPKVADFGLAKRIDTDSDLSRTGAILGTPGYMAPEQAAGKAKEVGPLADVWALGAILYELLTGRPPFRGPTVPDTLVMVRLDEPVPPSRLVGRLPRDLETICLKCLHKEPARRYATAADLADDLRRFTAGEPIHARPASAWERGWRWAKRRPAAAAVAAVSVAAAGLLVGTLLVSNRRITDAFETTRGEQRKTALALQRETEALEAKTAALNAVQAEKQQTQQALERERLTSYVHRISLAHREWLASNVGRAEQILGECPADLRNWEWHYLRRLCHAEQLAFRGHAGEVTAVAFSPDGSHVASTSWKEAKVWDAANGKEILTLPGQAGWGTGVAFSRDGKRLATAGFRTVKVWDAVSGKELLSIRAHDYLVTGVAFSPDGRRLATASGTPVGGGRREGGEVKVWDAHTGKELLWFADLPDRANAVAFSPDGKYLATGTGTLYHLAPSRPGEVRVWDAATGDRVLTLTGHTFWVTAVAFSPDSTRLASGGADRAVRIWEVPTGREVLTIRGHTGWVRGVTFSPQGDRLASAGDDQVVRIWDAATGQETLVLRGHTHPVRAVAFCPGGRRLVSAGGDSLKAGEVRVWDLTADQSARTFHDHTAPVTSVAFSPDGKFLASASNGMSSARPGETKIREVATGREQLTLKARMFGFSAVAFSPDGASVATAGDEGVKLWDARTGNQLRLLRAFTHPMHGLAFSPEGKRVAAVGVSGVTVWDAATGQELHHFRGHTINAYGVAFSPDGKRLATSSWGGYLCREVNGVKKTEKMPNEVKVWDTETGKELATLSGGGLGVVFSPDGKLVASGSQEGPVTIWDADAGMVLLTLCGHAGAVPVVAFSRDSRRLATGSADHTVKVWDTLIGQEVLTLRGHDEPVASVAFSPDGRYLASASALAGEPGQVKVWDAGELASLPNKP
jgi:WD40 repeat protein/tRNA A-37 threonylcarbamoyl transferase component Bud32